MSSEINNKIAEKNFLTQIALHRAYTEGLENTRSVAGDLMEDEEQEFLDKQKAISEGFFDWSSGKPELDHDTFEEVHQNNDNEVLIDWARNFSEENEKLRDLSYNIEERSNGLNIVQDLVVDAIGDIDFSDISVEQNYNQDELEQTFSNQLQELDENISGYIDEVLEGQAYTHEKLHTIIDKLDGETPEPQPGPTPTPGPGPTPSPDNGTDDGTGGYIPSWLIDMPDKIRNISWPSGPDNGIDEDKRDTLKKAGAIAAGGAVAIDYLNVIPGDKDAGDGIGRVGDCGWDFDAWGVYGEQNDCSTVGPDPKLPDQYTVSDSELRRLDGEYNALFEDMAEGDAKENTFYEKDGQFFVDSESEVYEINEEIYREVHEETQ